MNLSRAATWLTRLVSAGALTLGLAGALGLATTPAAASTGTGFLRLAHFSPNTPKVDVYLYSFGNPAAMVVLRGVGYGDSSPYESVAAGEYTVAMRLAGAAPASKPVLSTTVNVMSGAAYTVAGVGPMNGIRLQVLDDRLTAPRHKSVVRVIQASMHQASVTVTAGANVLGRNLNFTTVTGYRVVSPGTLTVRAVGATENGSSQFTLAPDTIYTFVVLDDPGHLTVAELVDAQGSQAIPTGGAATGMGGTAPRPGASLLPWLGLAAAGMLLAVGGAVGLRRRRRPGSARRVT
jgi:Domain of unknown function (DUF4397)